MTRVETITFAIDAGFNPMNSEEMDMFVAFAKLVEEKERKRILDVIGDNQCECRCAEVVRGQA